MATRPCGRAKVFFMVKIVSVKFKEGGKSYYFAPGNDTYEKGMGVIVETSKGLEYATVVVPDGEVDESTLVSPLKPVVRVATAKDEEQVKRNAERRGEALKLAQQKIEERGLEMKLVDCEFAFDGNKVVFYFTAESRVDFRELIKDLSSAFHSRIELRQINIREEIKMTGGLGMCGRECCCINCMKEPMKVSVKMAKNQGLSLNPTKISGLCGRLMCCLSYENDYYAEVCKQVPKVGSEIDTPDGRGTVVNVNMLKMTVKVKIEQNDAVTYHDFTVEEIRTGKRAPKEEPEQKSSAELILSGIADGENGEGDGGAPARTERGDRNDGNQEDRHGKRKDKNRHKKGGKENRLPPDSARGGNDGNNNGNAQGNGGNGNNGGQGGNGQGGKNGKHKHKGNRQGEQPNQPNQPTKGENGQNAPKQKNNPNQKNGQSNDRNNDKNRHNNPNKNGNNNGNAQGNGGNGNNGGKNGKHRHRHGNGGHGGGNATAGAGNSGSGGND